MANPQETLRRMEALLETKSSDLRKVNESIDRAKDKRSNLEREIETIEAGVELAREMVDKYDTKQLDLFAQTHEHEWGDWEQRDERIHIETRTCKTCHLVDRRCVHEWGEPYQAELEEGAEVPAGETLWRRACSHCTTIATGMAHRIDPDFPDKCAGCETPTADVCYWREIPEPLPEIDEEATEGPSDESSDLDSQDEASDATTAPPDATAGQEQPVTEAGPEDSEQVLLPGVEA